MTDPYEPPQADVNDTGKPPFSVPKFLLGLVIPFVLLGISYVAFAVIIAMMYDKVGSGVGDALAIIALATPPLLLVALEIYFIVKKYRELALGVAFSVGTILLLVAACFGLVFVGSTF
ncbi:hypothetical protein C7S18_09980 [Ahniella affigens]|uniref:Uncharacterized protein n=1 Tax=Ahniella affigens TaxID=2021234 RepID=A0A2P1PRQ4_9GAMM|nr:hypothetical protein [Ahniella affigens]AVP97502.1 hypothetical protein C7S18_09980 [Ahniella affigens]